MEVLIQLGALCLTAALLALLLRRTHAELGLALTLAAMLAGLWLLLPALRAAFALGEELLAFSSLPPALFAPLCKIAAIALVVRLGGALCRDAGQSALAALLELAGVVCAMGCAAPLLRAVVDMLREWL
ncbi:MAG: stage III sporulation AC/AD family protein [Oscillospiraceae bacterium]|nr:stage III sporulation AC/AD family protein [Oscillospiraceae bacterium]